MESMEAAFLGWAHSESRFHSRQHGFWNRLQKSVNVRRAAWPRLRDPDRSLCKWIVLTISILSLISTLNIKKMWSDIKAQWTCWTSGLRASPTRYKGRVSDINLQSSLTWAVIFALISLSWLITFRLTWLMNDEEDNTSPLAPAPRQLKSNKIILRQKEANRPPLNWRRFGSEQRRRESSLIKKSNVSSALTCNLSHSPCAVWGEHQSPAHYQSGSQPRVPKEWISGMKHTTLSPNVCRFYFSIF